MAANRRFKDSVFSLYMSDPKRLIEVYNAAEGTDYPPDTPVQINTLEDALFMERVNDMSFLLDGKLIVLIEHQSTVNKNMATRMLLYAARLYEKVLPDDAIYREKQIPIPTPKFIVLYNGDKPMEEHSVQRLSDVFMLHDGEPKLELLVDVYDISYSSERMPRLLQESGSLNEYSTFVHEVKTAVSAGIDFSEALKSAIRACISRNIMKEFLETHGSEVENMLFTEWNMETALKIRKEEGKQEGQAAIIKKLLKQYSIVDVSKMTGISEGEIKELTNQ